MAISISNQEIAKILREIGEYLAMDEIPFKPRAYERVAQVVEGLEQQVGDIYEKGGLRSLKNIPGVGQNIAEKIEELLKTGKLKYYEQLKRAAPVDLSTLTQIEGLGPKKIIKLYHAIKVRTLEDLEQAARANKIAKLEGFGQKSQDNILKGIDFLRRSGGRRILGFVVPEIRIIERRLRGLKEVEELVVAGSFRRRKETIGDMDILVVSKKPKVVMDFFTKMPEVVHVYAHGETKSSVKSKFGFDIDIRVVPRESYGAALNYFTGSKEHNVALREWALKQGYTLNEYGLYKGTAAKKGRLVAGKSEMEVYKKLGLDYIEPELREAGGELIAARNHTLPALIGYRDLKGDLQVQTSWTDGLDTIEAMARAAAAVGLEYIAITDHTKRLAMTGGLDGRKIQKQWEEIDAINRKLKQERIKMTILRGTECDILESGKLDLPDSILKQLDVVGVSIHSQFGMSRKDQTRRIIKAMENPNVDILFHPTGRIIQKRDPYDLDVEAVIAAAKDTGTVLEVNAFPDRADLKDEHIRKCVEAGVRLSIDSDAHQRDHFQYLEFGIAQARRGWASKADVINAWPLEKMLTFLKRH